MRFKRSQRVQELLLEEISKLLQGGLKDPRIGFATLTRVEVSDNLKHATVFVSVMGSEEEKNQTIEGAFNFALKTLLVLDGTNGSNMIKQVEIFSKSLDVTGLIITKLDGTHIILFLISEEIIFT